MIINEQEADVIMGLISFSNYEGQMAVADAQLGKKLVEAFPKLGVEYSELMKDIEKALTPESIEIDYKRRLTNLTIIQPQLTVEQLAERLGKSVEWIKARLK